MKRTLTVLLPLVLIGGLAYFYLSPKTANDNFKKKYTKQQRIEQAFAQEFDKTRDLSTNTIPSERLAAARQVAQQRLAAPIPGITWEERGPSNVGGRTRTMLFDANDATGRTVFAGSVGGGLWKTTDITAGTPNWTTIDDFWANIAVTAIAQDPNSPNTIYVGTGEGWYNADAIRGNGIWKSTDGGNNFTQLGSTVGTFRYVNKMVVGASGVVLASIRANNGGSGGVYRSTDGGATWTRTLSSTGTSISADIEVAANGDIYASMGFAFTYSDGIYRSTDNGATWTRVYDATTNGEGRIDLACAPSDANTVYALMEVGGGTEIRKTTNNGGSWTTLAQPTWDEGINWTRGQEWYDLAIAVDPNDANTLMIGGIDLFKSTNGGNSWTQVSKWYTGTSRPYVHADQHFILYRNSNDILFGNDGGVFRSTNGGTAFSTKSINYNVTQFYACATSNEAGATRFLAGSQDNGSHRYLNTGINATTEVTGGDGAFCHIDQDNPNIQITSYVYNYYWITSNAWGGRSTINLNGNGRFINPTDYDSDANILYCADASNTYAYIRNVGSGNNTGTTTVATFGGQISAVTASPNTNNRVFFGIDNGNIVRVENANTNSPTATLIGSTGNGFPGGYVSSVAVQRGNDNHLLVTFSNYGANSVWETTNGGGSWTSVEGNLPDMPVRWAEFNPNNPDQALLATELGVWTTTDLNGGSTDWGPSNAQLANVRTDMLQFRSSDNFLIAATHGRGLFSTTDFQAVPTVNFLCSSVGTLNVTGTTVDITGIQVQNNGAGASAGTAQIGFYLSLDPTITTADLLIGTDAIPVLAAGGTSTHSLNVDVSTLGLPAGTYYIGYIIDYSGQEPEVDETDNACGWPNPTVTIACSSLMGDCLGNSSFSESTVGQSDNYNNYNGAQYGTGYSGPEDLYEFTTPGGAVTITMSGLTADLDLILMSDCDVNSTFYAESVNAGTNNETITITLAAGTYYIYIDGWGGASSDYQLDINCAGVSVRPKVYLQGPLSGTTMDDGLRISNLVPSTNPYGTSMNESLISSLLSGTGNDAIVDWVEVELRDASDNTLVVATRSALLQRDGDVVDVDGSSAVKFVGVAAGNYYVAVKHRNHLSVMTNTTVTLN